MLDSDYNYDVMHTPIYIFDDITDGFFRNYVMMTEECFSKKTSCHVKN